MKYARVGVYSVQGDAIEVAKQAREGMLPIFRRLGGFVDYDLVAADGKLISFTTWQTQAQAAEGTKQAAMFVQHHLSSQLTLEQNYVGDIPVSSRT